MVSAMAFGVAISFTASWKLAAVILASCPLLVIGNMLNMRNMKRGQQGSAKAYKDSSGVMAEAIDAMREVKAYGLHSYIKDAYVELLEDPLKEEKKAAVIGGLCFGFTQLTIFGFYALAFWYGGKLITDGDTTYPDFLRGLFGLAFAAGGAGNAAVFMGDQAKGDCRC